MYEIFQKYIEEKAEFTQAESDLIQSFAIIKKLRKRQYLLQEGDSWKYDAFITQGCVRTYTVDEKGSEHVNSFSIENWWTGDRESLLMQQPSRFNIDAIEDTELVLFTHENFEMLCSEIPAFNNMVNAILQRSFIAAQNRIQASLTLTAEEKYLSFINKYPGFALRIPQTMIASYLGMTPETLSRIRKQTAKK